MSTSIANRWRLTMALNQALHACNLPALTYEQLACLADESREPEARGMVMDIADRVITSPTVSDFLLKTLAECLPVDPDDPDEGTAAYGGWDHDVTVLSDGTVEYAGMFEGIERTTGVFDTSLKCDPWMAPLITEFRAWAACNGFTNEDGDAGDILALARISRPQREWLIDFQRRWEAAGERARAECAEKGERRAYATWLDRMGMGPVAVLS